MQSWIFQGNPDRFDIDQYLRLTKDIYWSVTVKAYEDRIEPGDQVFIWRAMGKSKTIRGAIARGFVIERPIQVDQVQHPEYLFNNLWETPASEASDIKAGVHIEELRLNPEDGMLKADDLKLDPKLSNLHILTAFTGTNFPLSDEQAKRMRDLWEATEDPEGGIYADHEDYSVAEGRIRYQMHRARERNKALVDKAKLAFLQKKGKLFCEICGFSFVETYGELGRGFIEAHHKKPLSLLQPGEETSVEDLMMVCANCHRMIHRGDPVSNLVKLLKQFWPNGN